MRIRSFAVGLVIWVAFAAVSPAGAVVYTFGDATLSAEKVEMRLRERTAVATGSPRVVKGDWRASADSITLAYDERREPTRIDFTGHVVFRGKLPQGETPAKSPFADTLRGNASAADWVADPGSVRAGRKDEGILTFSGEPRLEGLLEDQVTATVAASTIVTRFNSGALSATGRVTLTRTGSSAQKDKETGTEAVTRYDAALSADAIDLRWDPDTQIVRSTEAKGSVTLRYVVEDPATREKMRVTAVCDAASWGRDPNWKADPGDDQGIARLSGNVSAESVTDDGKPETEDGVSKIACETLTYFVNERRTVAEGGPEGQVDLSVAGEE